MFTALIFSWKRKHSKGIIRSYKSKRTDNTIAKRKRTSTDLQNTIQTKQKIEHSLETGRILKYLVQCLKTESCFSELLIIRHFKITKMDSLQHIESQATLYIV
jgi:hypothetical protein